MKENQNSKCEKCRFQNHTMICQCCNGGIHFEAKPKEDNTLTEFEDALACAFCEVKTWKNDGNDTPVKEYAKVVAQRLLPIARKQFVYDVDIDALVEEFRNRGCDSQVDVRQPLITFVCSCYKHGLQDALLEVLNRHEIG